MATNFPRELQLALEAAAQQRINKKETVLQQPFFVKLDSNGRIRVYNTNTQNWNLVAQAFGDKMKEAFGDLLKSEGKPVKLGSVNIDADKAKLLLPKTPLFRRIGQYFEYATYREIQDGIKALYPDRTDWPSIPRASEAFLEQAHALHDVGGNISQRNLEIKNTIDEAAKRGAALLLSDSVLVQELLQKFEAVAAGNPAGDLRLGGIMLELKYYQNIESIRWFSGFTDSNTFQNAGTFRNFLENSGNTKLWDQTDDNNKPISTTRWVDNILSGEGFGKYMHQVTGEYGGNNELFLYLLNKGQNEVSANKRVLRITNINFSQDKNVRVELSADLSVVEAELKKQSMIGQFAKRRWQFILQSSGELVGDIQITTDLSQYSKVAKGGRERKSNAEIPNWESTAMTFWLQKAFWDMTK